MGGFVRMTPPPPPPPCTYINNPYEKVFFCVGIVEDPVDRFNGSDSSKDGHGLVSVVFLIVN